MILSNPQTATPLVDTDAGFSNQQIFKIMNHPLYEMLSIPDRSGSVQGICATTVVRFCRAPNDTIIRKEAR